MTYGIQKTKHVVLVFTMLYEHNTLCTRSATEDMLTQYKAVPIE